MRCASCAAENPAGARFCIQCGAEQALPTPIAAVAAAVSGQRGHAAVARAANAAQADLPHEHETDPRPRASVVAAASMREARSAAERRGGGVPNPALAQPAYAQGPSHGRLATFLIVLAFAVAAVALGAFKMLGGELRPDTRAPGPDRSVMSSFPPEATPNPRRSTDSQSLEASAPASPAAAAQSPAAAAPQTPSVSENKANETAAAASGGATQPIEIRSLPAKPATRPVHRRAAPDKAPPPAPPAEPSAPAPAPEVAAAAAPPSPVVDRWTRMADELSRCTREDFIARVICDQRVRFRYCGGYWGKVPQCPGSPAPERGQ